MPPIIVALLSAFVGVLIVGLAQPMVRRELPPSRAAGFRVRATLADPVVWYEANAAVGRALVRLGTLLAAGGLLLPWWLGRWAPAVLLPGAAFGLLGVAVWGSLRAERLLAARQAGAAPDAAPPTA